MDGTVEAHRHYRQNGYLFLPRFFDPGLIVAWEPICDRIFAQWLANHHTSYINDRLINMHSLSDPAYFADREAERIVFFNVLANGKLVQLCAELFGSGLYFHNTQLFFNPADRDKPAYWHRDLQYTGIQESEQMALLPRLLNLHARVALIPERGFELVLQTHRRWDTAHERAVRLQLDGHTNNEPLPDAVRLDLEPGDLLIFNAHMLHRGNYALNTARKALDILVGLPHPLMTQWLDGRLLPTRDEIERIDFSQWYRNAWDVLG